MVLLSGDEMRLFFKKNEFGFKKFTLNIFLFKFLNMKIVKTEHDINEWFWEKTRMEIVYFAAAWGFCHTQLRKIYLQYFYT